MQIETMSVPGVDVNIQVFNTMLRVRLENEQSFSPSQVLAEIETQRQLIPNRVLFHFCHRLAFSNAMCLIADGGKF